MAITRDCSCPLYHDETNMKNPPAQPPHIHLVCTHPDGGGKFWLGHFVEETLLSLQKTYCNKTELDYDRIIIIEQDIPVQGTLF